MEVTQIIYLCLVAFGCVLSILTLVFNFVARAKANRGKKEEAAEVKKTVDTLQEAFGIVKAVQDAVIQTEGFKNFGPAEKLQLATMKIQQSIGKSVDLTDKTVVELIDNEMAVASNVNADDRNHQKKRTTKEVEVK